jgi:hypothetical protein
MQNEKDCTNLYIKSILALYGQWKLEKTISLHTNYIVLCYMSILIGMAKVMVLVSISYLYFKVDLKYLKVNLLDTHNVLVDMIT